MGYLKADARADLLIAAAKKLIRKEGYTAVTARKIAKESGAAIGHINRHFASLNQLKCEAFLVIVNETVAVHQAASEALSGIDAVLALLYEPDKAQHETELWREVSVVSQQDKALHDIFVYALNLWHNTVSDAITRGIQQNLLRCHDTPSATAWRLIGLTLGQDALDMHGVLNDREDVLRNNLLHIIRLELQPVMGVSQRELT
ncbi:MAG: TetR family transcriptional regulator [Mixta calida]|jgi:AcrR family transcriptional regulator|uniref:TetR family transcriptional regulator n=1 Tax=Mixta calida TaxID=665913 RepID=A0ABM6S5I0_9GAMM|nr:MULTISPECIES: TetR family transcriptional regulator [Mixta]AIX72356.1 hypothetical protein PSNIH2_00255 [Pantoea sp. PSNIH2]AMJ32719.1 bacterial regulatory proteins, tetR family [uncultured bacterium]MBS6057471.1 TetR family transcriptional regulator [Pantoea sp.]MDU6447667.1 TetR family transcriptional regulator [Staphylococcus epidermidis]POU44128.1 TetR family transcriptional regulator [Pantoea sp. PSNIH5]POU64870.1 TetR family transcriptional regulator [Pantoea sp. PSNIH4]POY66714.1 T